MSVRANATERRAAAGERTALVRTPSHPMNDKRRGASRIVVGAGISAKGIGKQQKAILSLSATALVLMIGR